MQLRRVKLLLKALNKHNYSDISNKVIEAKAELTRLQELCSNNPVDPGNVLLDRGGFA